MKTSSITVTYNPDLKLLERQIESLIDEVYNIIVVDNGSTNILDVKNMLSKFKEFDKIVLIDLSENKGLGFAQNVGISCAKGNKNTHIIILDQDSILNSGFVKGMHDVEKELIANGSKVGAIGPIYFNETSGEIYPITKYSGPFIKRITPTSSPVEATFLIASGCFIPMTVFEDVGLMNEDLFIDYVDVEWCFRAKQHGYKLYATPALKMSHTIGDDRKSILGRTISVHSPLRRYYLYRNSIHMVRNSSIDTGYKIREVTFNLLRFIVFMALSDEKVKYFRYSTRGFLDGLKGKIGKCEYKF